jgi:hypothetical protein
MIQLVEFLHQARGDVVAILAASGPPGSDATERRTALMQGYDGLVHMLEDPAGDSYRAYVDRVLVPQMRKGTTPADLQQAVAPLLAAIQAVLAQQVADAAERQDVQDQLDRRLHRAYTLWQMVAVRIATERPAK